MNNRCVFLRLALVAIMALSSESYVMALNFESPLKVMPVYPFCNVNEVSIVVSPEWCTFTSHQVSDVMGNIELGFFMRGDGERATTYRIRATADRPGKYGFYGALWNEGKILLAVDSPIVIPYTAPVLKDAGVEYD